MGHVTGLLIIGLGILCLTGFAAGAEPQGDPQRGAQAFSPCSACHSIKPGDHMTGPSLAHAWGRKAGTAEGFMRYSDALKKSGVTWNEQTLDNWLTDPAAFIPGNAMSFPGIKDTRTRHDVIAYLKAVAEGKAPPAAAGRGMMGGGMMSGGMMGGSDGMRSMMQRMMGDVLPPALDKSFLPDPESRGATLLMQVCSQCHNFPGPGMHTATEWRTVVGRMYRRDQMMGGMMGVTTPTEGEVEVITHYLEAHAQRPIDERKYGSFRGSREGKVFSEICGQCHALPDPSQHTAADWPNVVARMLGHEHEMHKDVPNEGAAKEIIGFLQRHAK